MHHNFRKSLLAVCSLLEKYDVKYMLVGGAAVALTGYYRHSVNMAGEITEKPDIDIWYTPTYENYLSILKVIETLGQDITEFKNERDLNPRESFFKLDFEDFTLDFLPKIKASIKFSEAYQRVETVELDKVKIHFISFQDLLEDKRASARKKDEEDIEHLKKIRDEE